MHDDRPNQSGIDRRSLLRRTGVGVGIGLGVNGISTATAQERDEWTFDADVGAVSGLTAVSIDVQKDGDMGRVTHRFTYDLEAVDELEQIAGASLQLELPDSSADRVETQGQVNVESVTAVQRPVDQRELDRDKSASEPTERSHKSAESETDIGPKSDWDLMAWAKTTSPLCGTLAESDVLIDQYFYSGLDYYYDDSTLSTESPGSDCPWYIPIETEWDVESTDHDHDMYDIASEAGSQTTISRTSARSIRLTCTIWKPVGSIV